MHFDDACDTSSHQTTCSPSGFALIWSQHASCVPSSVGQQLLLPVRPTATQPAFAAHEALLCCSQHASCVPSSVGQQLLFPVRPAATQPGFSAHITELGGGGAGAGGDMSGIGSPPHSLQHKSRNKESPNIDVVSQLKLGIFPCNNCMPSLQFCAEDIPLFFNAEFKADMLSAHGFVGGHTLTRDPHTA